MCLKYLFDRLLGRASASRQSSSSVIPPAKYATFTTVSSRTGELQLPRRRFRHANRQSLTGRIPSKRCRRSPSAVEVHMPLGIINRPRGGKLIVQPPSPDRPKESLDFCYLRGVGSRTRSIRGDSFPDGSFQRQAGLTPTMIKFQRILILVGWSFRYEVRLISKTTPRLQGFFVDRHVAASFTTGPVIVNAGIPYTFPSILDRDTDMLDWQPWKLVSRACRYSFYIYYKLRCR